jgi:hypothetical protein
VILFALLRREAGGKWLAGVSRQRQQYWQRGFRKQSLFAGPALTVVQLVGRAVIAATHSFTHREIIPYPYLPNSIFAVTPMGRGP